MKECSLLLDEVTNEVYKLCLLKGLSHNHYAVPATQQNLTTEWKRLRLGNKIKIRE